MELRPWDPFAPKTRRRLARKAVPAPVVELPEDLDDLRKPELVALAQERGLDTDGTRAVLIGRLRGEG